MLRQSSALICLTLLAPLACGDSTSADTGLTTNQPTGVTGVTGASNVSAGATDSGSDSDSDTPTTGDGSASAGLTGSSATATTGPDSDATTDAPSTTTDATTATTSTQTTDPETSAGPGGDDDGSTGECAEIAETAQNKKQPADIIFVIDNSGSMQIEANSVKNNMNSFSTKIVESGVDAHVVLISKLDGDTGMCIAPPLGSGNCPVDDNNPPKFVHIHDSVGSNNALQKLLQHYPTFKDTMRPDGAKHVIVVSDDDAKNITAAEFNQQFKDLDPSHADYKFHAIVGAKDSGDVLWCAQNPACCLFTAAAGKVYLNLIQLTGGKFGDLCKQDFTPVFDELSAEVIQNAGLACEWDIPAPMGDDQNIDYDKVNVDFEDGQGNVQPIGKVDTLEDCDDVADGWYFDNNDAPTKIYVCPQTCADIQKVLNAKMSIKFGCETIYAQ